jgi:hypothetical protein
MVDTIIVYMIRGTRKTPEEPKEEKKDKIFVKTYGTDIMPEKHPEMIDSFFHPYKNYTKK